MADFYPGDTARFLRNSTAGGRDFGLYREEVTIRRRYMDNEEKGHVWQIFRPNGPPGMQSCNAYGIDLALAKAVEIKGDNDADCI
jgi:hypothetical protein